MSDFLSFYAMPVAIGAVALVLLLGLVNMMRGGSPNTSQKLMRLRVLLQFVAIIVAMTAIWVLAYTTRRRRLPLRGSSSTRPTHRPRLSS